MPSSTMIQGAYGSVPAGVPAVSTAPGATAGAIAQGQLAYSQLPGYTQSLGNIGGNIQSLTAGEVPEDVQNLLARSAAERGVGRGFPGSPNVGANYLDALGLTSLDLQKLGTSEFSSILPQLPGAQISQNPNFYPTTGQNYESALQSSIFGAAPNPAAAAMANLQAAQAGYGAGTASGPGGFPTPPPSFGSVNTSTPQDWGTPKVYGAYGGGLGTSIGGQIYAPGTEPGTMSNLNGIINNYADSVYGGSIGGYDTGGGDTAGGTGLPWLDDYSSGGEQDPFLADYGYYDY